MRIGKYQEALIVAIEGIGIDSTEYNNQLTLAKVYNHINEPDKALEVLNNISSNNYANNEISTSNIESVYGEAYYLKEDYKKAIEYYLKAIDKHPHMWKNIYFLAKSYHEGGDNKKACEYYKKCIEIANSTLTEEIILHKDIHHFKVQFDSLEDAERQLENLNCP